MAQGVKRSYHWRLVVIIGVQSGLSPFNGDKKCAARYSLEHIVMLTSTVAIVV